MIKKSVLLPVVHFNCSLHKEPLNLVCLYDQCSMNGLICVQCQYENHKHPIKSLGCLLEEIYQDVESQQKNLNLLSRIDELYSQALEKGKRLKDISSRKILIQTIHQYYKGVSNQIISSTEKSRAFLKMENLSLKKFNKQLLTYKFQTRQENEKDLSNSEIEIKNKLEAFKQSVKDLEQAIKAEQSLDKMLILFTLQQEKKIKYQFNPEKKNKDIILVDKHHVKMKDGYSYRVALLDPPIRKQNGKTLKRNVTFKIGKVSAIIGIGMCYTKKIADLSYIFSAYSQHGCYLIANGGYTYNESNSQYNSQIKNWSFQKDDVINVLVDPKDKKVHFKRDDSTFEFPYEEKPEFELCFGVMMCCGEESVQIVNG